ncbi:MAG: hypothetical protein IPI19_04895 [Ignavibacteriales bacterium]|nr:hypothetical protein [Ignavibacteriales bacterium]
MVVIYVLFLFKFFDDIGWSSGVITLITTDGGMIDCTSWICLDFLWSKFLHFYALTGIMTII